jgi:UDP-N-acetylmuramate: L-alanyl-gamma-D-glutamyl-meso-diaminopimelate ligase
MRVHLVGVSGTGMGQLAKLLRDAGEDVTGSDVSFDPPMGPMLEAAGVRCLPGWSADHVSPDLGLVVVGNAIRRDNVEAARAAELDLPRASMSGALRERFLAGKRPLVVTGTHGKTTTSSMCAWILDVAGLEPGFFIGGVPKNFGVGARAASSRRRFVGATAKAAPFVVEGDEYDAVYWHKKPKFFDYVNPPGGAEQVVLVTSVEHDHVDIYPTAEVYERQFAELAARIPEDGLIACDARDPRAREIVSKHARCRTAFYAIDGDDTGSVTPTWLGAMVPADPETGAQPFDLYLGGSYGGRFALRVPGAHNVRNALGAIAACAEGFGVDVEKARQALGSFEGVRRRQDLLGTPNGVAVYDDFAHHPTAVDETLRALRSRHPDGRLWAIFEPRSATACRSTHQHEYAAAFGAADRVLFAPLGRTNIPEHERLDLARVAAEIGPRAAAAPSIDAIVDTVLREARPGDVIALLSNGAFGGLHARLLGELGKGA